MKKAISIILAALLVVSLSIPAFAVPRSAGINILRHQFDHGEGPYDSTSGLNVDYSYYCPVEPGKSVMTYPLVVITPGALEGQNEGEELYENNFAMWACDEFQKEFFFSKGAYIMIARAQEDISLLYNWSSSALTTPLLLAIDDFCDSNPNVDRNRIYGIGWCQGAKGIINLEVKYPDVFNTLVLMVQNFELSDSDAAKLSGSNVWFMGSKYDTLGLYNQYIKPSWDKLKENWDGSSLRIFTSYSKAQNTGLAIQHDVWNDACYNWDYSPKTTYAKKTVDANGNTVTISSFIAYLSRFGAERYDDWQNPRPPMKLICDDEHHDYNPLILRLIRAYNKVITLLAEAFNRKTEVVCSLA